MKMTVVDSTLIYSFGYDDHALYVKFQSGECYRYAGVSKGDYLEMKGMVSPDEYFQETIQNNYNCRLVRL